MELVAGRGEAGQRLTQAGRGDRTTRSELHSQKHAHSQNSRFNCPFEQFNAYKVECWWNIELFRAPGMRDVAKRIECQG